MRIDWRKLISGSLRHYRLAIAAVVLLLVGYVLYHEPLSWSKIVGVVICLIGLVFLNR